MSAAELLTTLRRHGALVYLKDGQLRINRPKDCPPDLIAQARTHRAELLALLATQVPTSRALTPRERLWAGVGDEGLVGRYGPAIAGELLRLAQEYEAAQDHGRETRDAAEAFEAALRRAETLSPEPPQPAAAAGQKAQEGPRSAAAVFPKAPSWPAELGGVVSRLLELNPGDLPAEPWALRPGVTVCGNARFLAALKQDIAQGPSGPRARTGALQQDMSDLAKLLDHQEETRHG